jgi:hypothetical protein
MSQKVFTILRKLGYNSSKGAVKSIISVFSIVLGIAGIEHGVGEILQRNTTPEGLFIESWPNSELYEILAGEPAMTIIPNFLLSGILSIIVSLTLILWATGRVSTINYGKGLIIISILLLLVGGGFGPPIIGLILGFAGTRIDSRFPWVINNVDVKILSNLSGYWRYLLTTSVIGWFFIWPGTIILAALTGYTSEVLVVITIIFSFCSLFLTLVSGFSYDILKQIREG